MPKSFFIHGPDNHGKGNASKTPIKSSYNTLSPIYLPNKPITEGMLLPKIGLLNLDSALIDHRSQKLKKKCSRKSVAYKTGHLDENVNKRHVRSSLECIEEDRWLSPGTPWKPSQVEVGRAPVGTGLVFPGGPENK